LESDSQHLQAEIHKTRVVFENKKKKERGEKRLKEKKERR